MAKRQVVALTSTSPNSDAFPLTRLHKMNEHIARAIDEVYHLTYHQLDRHDYRFKHQPGSSDSLKEVIDHFYPLGDYRDLRAVLSQTSGAVDFDPGTEHKNLVYSAASTTRAWKGSPGENIFCAVDLPASWMACRHWRIFHATKAEKIRYIPSSNLRTGEKAASLAKAEYYASCLTNSRCQGGTA